MEIQIEDNKIFAPLKAKWLVAKPEEEVRQKYICRLVDSYGYSLDQMDQELKVNNSHRGQGAARADIVVWRNKEDKGNSKSKGTNFVWKKTTTVDTLSCDHIKRKTLGKKTNPNLFSALI